MKARTIINHLKTYLPRYTNKFTTTLYIETLSSVANVVSCKSTAHGLLTGNYVSIKNVKIPYSVTSLNKTGEIATLFTTTQTQSAFDTTIEIIGANESDYNGTKTLIDSKPIQITNLVKSGDIIIATTKSKHNFIVNSNFKIEVYGVTQQLYNQENISITSIIDDYNFTYTIKGNITSPATTNNKIYCKALRNDYTMFFEIDSGASDTATGTIQLLKYFNDGYNGFYSITKVDADNFTYTMNYSSLPQPYYTNSKLEVAIRIDGVNTPERLTEIITNREVNNFWLLYLPADTTIGKDKNQETDANYITYNGNQFSQLEIFNFNLMLVIPTTSSLGGIDGYDEAITIKQYIYKSLLGYQFDIDLSTEKTQSIVPIGDGVFDYQNAYYIHRFTFQGSMYINNTDTFQEYDTFSLNKIEEDIINSEDENQNALIDIRF